MKVDIPIPEPDHDAFSSWVKGAYSNDRWSDVTVKKDGQTGGSVTIQSGKHPAYRRFIDDLRPKLHEHGFVISRTEEDKYIGIDDEKEPIRRHVVTAIPMLWVAAYTNGMVCNRGACRNIAVNAYCESCEEYCDSIQTTDEIRMVNP